MKVRILGMTWQRTFFRYTGSMVGERPYCIASYGASCCCCASSNLSRPGFIGDLNRVGIACVDGDATPTSRRGHPPRISNLDGAAVGIDRPAPSDRRAGAQWNSSAVFSPLGSLFWIFFSRWWPQWRDSLIIVQPETVLR